MLTAAHPTRLPEGCDVLQMQLQVMSFSSLSGVLDITCGCICNTPQTVHTLAAHHRIHCRGLRCDGLPHPHAPYFRRTSAGIVSHSDVARSLCRCAVLGSPAGLAITISLVFSPVNVKLSAGLDQTACGLSTAMIGFFVNLFVTVVLGVIMERKPELAGQAFAAVRSMMPHYDHINIGRKRDPLINPYLWAAIVTVLLFTVPFYRVPLSLDVFVGDMSSWAFVALMLSGVLAVLVSFAYLRMWESFEAEALPSKDADAAGAGSAPSGLELPGADTFGGRYVAAVPAAAK